MYNTTQLSIKTSTIAYPWMLDPGMISLDDSLMEWYFRKHADTNN